MIRLILILTMVAFPIIASADETDTIHKDAGKSGLIGRVVSYLSETNKVDTVKRFDLSVVGGPFYTKETNFGIGLVAAGLYKKNPADTTEEAGQVNLYGKLSVSGFYKLGIDGIHFMDTGNRKIIYDTGFESAPDKFWGIGYHSDKDDANETDYKRWHAYLDATMLIKAFAENFFIGPHIMLDYLNARNVENTELWGNRKLHSFSDAFGVKMEYDTRDYRFNARHGIYLSLDQMFAPRFIGNREAFSSTDFSFRYYTPAWKGAVVATNIHTRLTYGNTPWGMMSKIGGSYTMRGYWEGRYNDKCASDATVELRQHIYGRSGIVLWAGVGEVYAKPKDFCDTPLLFNCGTGYRWEFKKRVNVRIDCGFGRNQFGVVFNLNEAF